MANKSKLNVPGPGEYESKTFSPGPAHLIGNGPRSDLGIGKSFVGPGVGEYNVGKELGGS